uniref:Armadillo/beta-catenin-like repeat protein n=1 Tax=Heterorhabditis bacteriophora TaxID=37862 RepID=A0A1I7WYI0_HETBA
MRSETHVVTHMQQMRVADSEYANDFYQTYQDSLYTDARISRIRAAMFPEVEAGPSNVCSIKNTIVDKMATPACSVKNAVLNLLRFEGCADISALSVPDLIQLMADNDERVYLMSKEDHTIATYPYLIEALLKASKSDNLNVKRDAMGALSHLSEHPDGRLHIFRSGGLAELIRMLYCAVESVVHYAVTTLRNLLIHVDAMTTTLNQIQNVEPLKVQARALGAIEALSPLLFRTNPRLLAQVADSLYFLLLDDPQSKVVFLSLGGPQTLVYIMNNYSEHRKLMYTVIRCIRSLSVCPQNKAALISLGCLPALFNELCRATEDRTQLAVLVAMRNLSDAATNEDNLTPLVIYFIDYLRVVVSEFSMNSRFLFYSKYRNRDKICAYISNVSALHYKMFTIIRFVQMKVCRGCNRTGTLCIATLYSSTFPCPTSMCSVSALHQLASHPSVATTLCNDELFIPLIVELLGRPEPHLESAVPLDSSASTRINGNPKVPSPLNTSRVGEHPNLS